MPTNGSGTMTIRLPDHVIARVTLLAAKKRITRNSWLVDIVIRATGCLPDGTIRKHSRKE